jgi:hypothetical protein
MRGFYIGSIVSSYAPSTNALVTGPKNPILGTILFPFWNLIRAALVAGPKRVVSFPVDPGNGDGAIG